MSQRAQRDLATEHQQLGIYFSPSFSLLENNATTKCLSLQSSQFQILPQKKGITRWNKSIFRLLIYSFRKVMPTCTPHRGCRDAPIPNGLKLFIIYILLSLKKWVTSEVHMTIDNNNCNNNNTIMTFTRHVLGTRHRSKRFTCVKCGNILDPTVWMGKTRYRKVRPSANV